MTTSPTVARMGSPDGPARRGYGGSYGGGGGSNFAGARGLVLVSVLAVIGLIGLLGLIHTGVPAIGQRSTVLIGIALVLAVVAMPSIRLSVFVAVLGVMGTALIRRVYPTPDPVSDVAAVMPFIMMAPLCIRAVASRVVPWTVGLGLALFAANIVRDPTSGAPALLSIAAPTLAGLYIRSNAVATRAFVRSWLWLIPIALVYTVYQHYKQPVWDVNWVINAHFPYSGIPGQPGFRAFGPFPAPAIAAFAAALTLLIVITTNRTIRVPTWLSGLAFTIALVSLALSGVRSAWLFGATAILVAILSNARPSVRYVFLPVTIVGVMAVLTIPALSSVFYGRADTLTNLSSDRSFNSRATILSHTGQLFSVFGGGLGSGTNAEGTVNASSDNGYLIVLGEGGIIGVIALLLVLYGVLRHLDRDRFAFAVLWLMGCSTGYYFTNSVAFIVISMCALTVTTTAGEADAEESPPDEVVEAAVEQVAREPALAARRRVA